MERSGKYTRLIALAASGGVVAVLYLAKGVLIPFALAMLVSFLLAPLVLRLQRLRVPRILAVSLVMSLVLALAGAGGWLVVEQVRQVAACLNEHQENIREKVATLRELLGAPTSSVSRLLADLEAGAGQPATQAVEATAVLPVQVVEIGRGPFELIRDALGPALEVLLTGAMVMVFAFVMLLHRDDLGDRFIRLVGQGKIAVTTHALREASRMVSDHLWRLLLLNGVHGLAVGIGLALIGVPNAPLWGAVSCFFRFIPFLGPWIAASFPILTALAVSSGWSLPLSVMGLFAVLELVGNNVLEPWTYGKGAGISTLAILVSALFWALLWGPVGLVLSIPLTVCLLVIGRHVPSLHFLQFFFGDAPGLKAASRLYQRLIAGDQDQAWLVLRTEMAQQSLEGLYDNVVLPALSMAERDRQQGTLDEKAQGSIEETVRLLIEEALEQSPSVVPVLPGLSEQLELRVLCLPAHGTADALAALMLSQLLASDGLVVEVSSTAELAAESLDRLEKHGVDLVCISAVPPSRFMHVRYLCKRIAERHPQLPIIAGMWTLEPGTPELADRLSVLHQVHVVTSLGQARAKVREFADQHRIERRSQSGVPVAAL